MGEGVRHTTWSPARWWLRFHATYHIALPRRDRRLTTLEPVLGVGRFTLPERYQFQCYVIGLTPQVTSII
jgi:hypothetical protein